MPLRIYLGGRVLELSSLKGGVVEVSPVLGGE